MSGRRAKEQLKTLCEATHRTGEISNLKEDKEVSQLSRESESGSN